MPVYPIGFGADSLVRVAFPGKPRVSVDAHERAPNAPVAGHEIGRNAIQPGLKGADEGQGGLQDVTFVPLFVLLKPGAVVVVGRLIEKLKKRWPKSLELHDRSLLRQASRIAQGRHRRHLWNVNGRRYHCW